MRPSFFSVGEPRTRAADASSAPASGQACSANSSVSVASASAFVVPPSVTSAAGRRDERQAFALLLERARHEPAGAVGLSDAQGAGHGREIDGGAGLPRPAVLALIGVAIPLVGRVQRDCAVCGGGGGERFAPEDVVRRRLGESAGGGRARPDADLHVRRAGGRVPAEADRAIPQFPGADARRRGEASVRTISSASPDCMSA